MIDSMLSSPTIRMLEQTLSFTEQRHGVLVSDIVNLDTPGFVQKDLSVDEFQQALRGAIRRANEGGDADYAPQSGETVGFETGTSRVYAHPVEQANSVAFHDRGVRSAEYLMSELADNALAHNMAAQFLKNRYDQLSRAISMKV